MNNRSRTFSALAFLALLALAGAACSGDGDEGWFSAVGPNSSSTSESVPAPTEDSDQSSDERQEASDVATPEKPEIEIPEGEAPTDLQVDDLVEGDGAEATAGSTVEVHYVGVLFSDGTEFDASYDRGESFNFTLGAGQVIQGWDEGVEGMKVGGRRRLVIPSDLAYGETGAGGVIPPNATLVFVVDLLSVS